MKVTRIYHAGRDAAHRERDRALHDAGVDLTVIVPKRWPGPDEIGEEAFRLIELDVRRPGDVNRHTYQDPAALKAAIGRPDVVDIHEEPFSAVTHQILGLLPAAQPVVSYTAQNIDKRFPPPYAHRERAALSRIGGLYPCSRQAASVAVGKGYGGPVEVLPLAPPAAMTPAPQAGPPGDELRLLLAGRMVPEKGVRDAIRLVARLGPRARLHLVGEGPELDGASRLAYALGAGDRLEVSAWAGAEDLADAYRQAHVTLVPSRETRHWVEQFGRVVVEAQACGSVVVAYGTGALPEVVADAGVVVPDGDEAALYAAVTRLATHPDEWSDLRDAGLRAAVGRTWAKVAESQIALYEQATGATTSHRAVRKTARELWGSPALDGARPVALPAQLRGRTPLPSVRPLKVVYLDHVALLSGGELALLRLIPAIPEIDAHVILAEDGPLRPALEAAGATVEVIAMRESARSLRRGEVAPGRAALSATVDTAAYVAVLARRLRELKPDLVHTNSLKSGYYGSLAARLAGVPVIWHVRDRIASDYLPTTAARSTRLALRMLPNAVIVNSRATLASTGLRPRQGDGRLLVRLATPSVLTIGDPIDGSTPRSPTVEPVVGIVGRLAGWKGQDVFLRAMALLVEDHPALQARIVGSAMFDEGDVEAGLHELCRELGLEDRVTFTGFVSDVPGQLAEIAVLVHASTLPEPFGQVIVEGLAAGLPVVATRGGGASEIITDEVDGLLIAPSDPAALAAALRRLLADPDLRSRLGTAGRIRAADFQPAAIGGRVRLFYDRAVSESASSRSRADRINTV